MGRLLGSHADEQELDRPDLNKCPDCGCYFPQENCPLCGKPCPENMRAGNRAPVKHVKNRRRGRERVVFVEWYHSWWFIILTMLLGLPIIGIILLITSPHSTRSKVVFVSVGVLLSIIFTFGLSGIIGRITSIFEKPVDTSMTRAEYVSACKILDPESYYRAAGDYEDEFISVKLKVVARITDSDAEYNGDKHPTYYICTSVDGGEYEILVRSCLVDSSMNFIPGDVIKVYGEGAGEVSVTDNAEYETHTAPCINMAYFGMIE